MKADASFSIRPAGRHLLTIGRDLVHDGCAAIVEMVKNAYDADASFIRIKFECVDERENCKITISDDGRGMSRSDVLTKWMVPSTSNKITKRTSQSGRKLQGSKGIGRYATSLLGDRLFLETISEQGEKTTLHMDWVEFENAKFLDEVEIAINTKTVSTKSGTQLTISGGPKLRENWNDESKLYELMSELKKLVSPLDSIGALHDGSDQFSIYIETAEFNGLQDRDVKVEPYPIMDLFNYRISGNVSKNGKGVLSYTKNADSEILNTNIKLNLGKPTGCGNLLFDIRVFDREKESVESLIERGLRKETGEYFGKLEARKLLNEYNGIGVYRNGFRIRPLGDPDFDWLKLNFRRVQNPSLRIGSNQVIGYVQIESEEKSGLVEKSARDGLLENAAYDMLKSVTLEVLVEIEKRRFEFRGKAGLSRSIKDLDSQTESTLLNDALKLNIEATLREKNADKDTISAVNEVIQQDSKNKMILVDGLQNNLAAYQGQATLGKIMEVVLHESGSPLTYFNNQGSNIQYWYQQFQKDQSEEHIKEILKIVKGIERNTKKLVDLFNRLDVLATRNVNNKQLMNLSEIIEGVVELFRKKLGKHKIDLELICPIDFKMLVWSQDIASIFVNLIDNSIYWMVETKCKKRKIKINIVQENGELQQIDIIDSGPGIDSDSIESGTIFEPYYSTKKHGTGLGLAIAGEAAKRNGLVLSALKSETGSYFRLQPVSGREN